MQLLEPGFSVAGVDGADLVVGRLPIEADPAITAALDRALGLVGWDCRDLARAGMGRRHLAGRAPAGRRGLGFRRPLVAEDPEGISDGVRGRLELGGSFDEDTVAAAWRVQRAWKETLERVFAEVDLLVTPTLSIFPPPPRGRGRPAGVALHPSGEPGRGAGSLAPGADRWPACPASMQLIGPAHSEERLLAAAALLEAAVA